MEEKKIKELLRCVVCDGGEKDFIEAFRQEYKCYYVLQGTDRQMDTVKECKTFEEALNLFEKIKNDREGYSVFDSIITSIEDECGNVLEYYRRR